EAVLKHLDHAFADDLDVLGRELLQDREHQLLLAHHAGVLDLERFSEGDQLGRAFALQFLKFHFLHRADSGIGKTVGRAAAMSAGKGLPGAEGADAMRRGRMRLLTPLPRRCKTEMRWRACGIEAHRRETRRRLRENRARKASPPRG